MPHPTRPPRERPRTDDPLDRIPPHKPRPSAAAAGGPATPPAGADQPTDPPPDPTDGRIPGTPARQFLEAQAGQLEDTAWGTYLYGSMSGFLGEWVKPVAYQVFLGNFLADVAPAGPVERMMAEQLLLTHHVIGQLHAKAMNAANPDTAKIFLAAAARLMGEHRQTALALKAYRAAPAGPIPVAEKVAPAPTHPRPSVKADTPGPQTHNPASTPGWCDELVSNHRLRGLFRDEPLPA